MFPTRVVAIALSVGALVCVKDMGSVWTKAWFYVNATSLLIWTLLDHLDAMGIFPKRNWHEKPNIARIVRALVYILFVVYAIVAHVGLIATGPIVMHNAGHALPWLCVVYAIKVLAVIRGAFRQELTLKF
jgi:hypothetical protein